MYCCPKQGFSYQALKSKSSHQVHINVKAWDTRANGTTQVDYTQDIIEAESRLFIVLAQHHKNIVLLKPIKSRLYSTFHGV